MNYEKQVGNVSFEVALLCYNHCFYFQFKSLYRISEAIWARIKFSSYFNSTFASSVTIEKVEYDFKGDGYFALCYLKSNPEIKFSVKYSRENSKNIISSFPVAMWERELMECVPNNKNIACKISIIAKTATFFSTNNFYYTLGESIPKYSDDEEQIIYYFSPPSVYIDFDSQFFSAKNLADEFCDMLYTLKSKSKYCEIDFYVDGKFILDINAGDLQEYSKEDMQEFYNQLKLP